MLTIVLCLVVIGVACFAVLRITFEDENQPATAPKQRHRAPEASSVGVTGARAASLEDDTDVIEVEAEPTAPLPSPPAPPGPSVDALADDTVATKITSIPSPPPPPAPPAPTAKETPPFGGTALPDVDEPSPVATGWPDDLDEGPEPLGPDDQTGPAPRTVESLSEGAVAPSGAPEPLGESSSQTEPPDHASVRVKEEPAPRTASPPRPATVDSNGAADVKRSGAFDDDVATVVLTPIDARRRLRSTGALLLTLTVVGALVALAVVLLLALMIVAVRSALGA